MTLNERLLAVADLWCEANDRRPATLSSRVANDGKLLDRLREGAGCNVATLERFAKFFRDPANWPDGAVPAEVGDQLDGVDLGAAHAVNDTGQAADPSAGNNDTASPREVSHA